MLAVALDHFTIGHRLALRTRIDRQRAPSSCGRFVLAISRSGYRSGNGLDLRSRAPHLQSGVLNHAAQESQSRRGSRETRRGWRKAPGVATTVQRQTLVPEADIYVVATFYSLLAEPEAGTRVCQGLTCNLDDSAALMEELKPRARKLSSRPVWDVAIRAPHSGTLTMKVRSTGTHCSPSSPDLAIDLEASDSPDYEVLHKAARRASMGAGRARGLGSDRARRAPLPCSYQVASHSQPAETDRYVVLNADEGEPGTSRTARASSDALISVTRVWPSPPSASKRRTSTPMFG